MCLLFLIPLLKLLGLDVLLSESVAGAHTLVTASSVGVAAILSAEGLARTLPLFARMSPSPRRERRLALFHSLRPGIGRLAEPLHHPVVHDSVQIVFPELIVRIHQFA